MNVYVNIIKAILAILLAALFGYYAYPYILLNLLTIKELSIAVIVIFSMGIIFTAFRFVSVYSKVNWLDSYKSINRISTVSRSDAPKEFKNLSDKLNEEKTLITADDCYVCEKSLETTINSNRDAGKFLVKLCFIISLLSAMLCVISSLTDIANIFAGMSLEAGDSLNTLSDLQTSIESPLKALSNALAVSFLGIFLSSLLSYIDRQVFIAENKVLVYLENWFLSCLNIKEK